MTVRLCCWSDQSSAPHGSERRHARLQRADECTRRRLEGLLDDALAPLHLPRRPLLFMRFGLKALQPAALFARRVFRGERARALFAGLAAHSDLPLRAFHVGVCADAGHAGHAVGWPLARGGSGRIADALTSRLAALGGSLQLGQLVTQLDDLPPTRHVLLDLTPRQIVAIAGDALPDGYRRKLQGYRYGPGVFKVDYALNGPIPWRAAACGACGHGPPRRDAGGDRRVGSRRDARRASRTSLRHPGATVGIR